MQLAVDLYHPTTGRHRRIVVDASSGDEAALVASRMAPGLHVRAVVPAPDVGVPELRLPPGLAARYDGDPAAGSPVSVEDGAAEATTSGPEKRGRGRPPGVKNKPKIVADSGAEVAQSGEIVARGPEVARPSTEGEPL